MVEGYERARKIRQMQEEVRALMLVKEAELVEEWTTVYTEEYGAVVAKKARKTMKLVWSTLEAKMIVVNGNAVLAVEYVFNINRNRLDDKSWTSPRYTTTLEYTSAVPNLLALDAALVNINVDDSAKA